MNEASYELLRQGVRHWWLYGRNVLIGACLRNALGKRKDLSILDIGSGYGTAIEVLKRFGTVDAVEPYAPAHAALRKAGVSRIHACGDFPAIYPECRYDLVTLFDVLEHIEDDSQALNVIQKNLLSPGGTCMLTVPAYQWLWTVQDDDARHYRRYTAGKVRAVLSRAGFRQIRISYCMTFLFGLALIQKIRMKCGLQLGEVFKMPHPLINAVLKTIFGAERLFVPFVRFPFGLSIIAIARK